MKGMMLAMAVAGFGPLMMAAGMAAAALRRRLANLFDARQARPAVAAPPLAMAIKCHGCQEDNIARQVAVRGSTELATSGSIALAEIRATERRTRPASIRKANQAVWREASFSSTAAQETPSRPA